MKKLLLFSIPFILVSCSLKSYPIKGSYQNTPFISYSEKPFEQVWSKLIDVFAQKGISINVIDKTSGLIITEEYSFINKWAVEYPNGKLSDSTAWVVVNRISNDASSRMATPETITGKFNIRLKEENGKTSINVNITNLKGIYQTVDIDRYIKSSYEQVISTGVFEKEFADLIK